jgi:hypothetical protein
LVERETLDALAGYLEGDSTLSDFHSWVVHRLDASPAESVIARNIASMIEGALAGGSSLTSLREELSAVYIAALTPA